MKINITPMGTSIGEPRARVIGETPRKTVVELCNTFECAFPQGARDYSPPSAHAAIWLTCSADKDTVRFFESDPNGVYESARLLLILQEAITYELNRIIEIADSNREVCDGE